MSGTPFEEIQREASELQASLNEEKATLEEIWLEMEEIPTYEECVNDSANAGFLSEGWAAVAGAIVSFFDELACEFLGIVFSMVGAFIDQVLLALGLTRSKDSVDLTMRCTRL